MSKNWLVVIISVAAPQMINVAFLQKNFYFQLRLSRKHQLNAEIFFTKVGGEIFLQFFAKVDKRYAKAM